MLDPLCRQIEPHPNGHLEIWELCVFNIVFRSLVICFLVFCHPVPEPPNLVSKLVLDLPVDSFVHYSSLSQIAQRVVGSVASPIALRVVATVCRESGRQFDWGQMGSMGKQVHNTLGVSA